MGAQASKVEPEPRAGTVSIISGSGFPIFRFKPVGLNLQ